MMEPGSPTADSDYREGLVHKMKTTIHKIASLASYRHRGSDSATGPGGISHSAALGARPVFAALALAAALSAGFLLLMHGGPAHAQEAQRHFTYAENGKGSVATFAASDPEGVTPIVWSLLDNAEGVQNLGIFTDDGEAGGTANDGVDDSADDVADADIADHALFKIEDGVLSFKSPPDFEETGTDNEHHVVVQASDGGTMLALSWFKVTVTVTNEEEDGKVTWTVDHDANGTADTPKLMQFQAGAQLVASVTDDDGNTTNVRWQWYRSSSKTAQGTAISGGTSATYIAQDKSTDNDVGMYLRAVATYSDPRGPNKTASLVSDYPVQASREDNAIPVFALPTATRQVTEGKKGTSVGAPVTATDADNDVLNYVLDGADADKFKIDQETGQITIGDEGLNFEADDGAAGQCAGANACAVTVNATDSAGEAAASPVTVTITVTDLNEKPTFSEGAEMAADHAEGGTVIDGDPDTDDVQAAAYTATDPEGGVVTLSLMGDDAGMFALGTDRDTGNGVDRVLSFGTGPDFEMPGDSNGDNIYEVTVRASDGVMYADRMVTVKVTDADEAGSVELSSQDALIGVELTATLTDSDGGVPALGRFTDVTWRWHKLNAVDDELDTTDDDTNNVIEDETSDSYTPVADDRGMYLKAVATYTDRTRDEDVTDETDDDGNALFGNTAESGATTAVRNNPDNQAPKFKEGASTFRVVAEGTSALSGDADDDAATADDNLADNVGGPIEATDADADIPTYTLSGADAGMFRVRANGQIEVSSGANLDYETKKFHTIRVTADDGYGGSNSTASITVTIYVTNVDDAPMIRDSADSSAKGEQTVSYAEKGEGSVLRLSASDPERVTPIVWGFLEDAEGVQNLGIFTDDGEAGGTANDGVDDSADDVADADIADHALFKIEDGVLSFKSPPDFEETGTDNEHHVVVQASDGGTMLALSWFKVTVTVTNEEEDGKVTWTVDHDANGTADTPKLMQFQAGAQLVASVTDDDGNTASVRWQWYRSSSKTAQGTAISGATSATYSVTDSPANDNDVGKYLRAMATYNVGASVDDETASLVSDYKVRAARTQENSIPVFASAAIDRRVTEGKKGTSVGAPVTATDADNDVLNYVLDGADADKFKIDQETGQITIGDEGLNFEADDGAAGQCAGANACAVTVNATDSAGEAAASPVTVTITVTDLNEKPTFSEGAEMAADHAEGGTVIDGDPDTDDVQAAAYTATDPEGGVVTLSLMGDDAGMFALGTDRDTGNGVDRVLSFGTGPDFEMPGDSNGDNIYEVTVRASDGVMYADRMVTVKVTDADEAGSVELSSQDALIGVELTATLTDSDGGVPALGRFTDVTWRWHKLNAVDDELDTSDDESNNVIEDETSDSYTPVADDRGSFLRAVATYTDRTRDEDVTDETDDDGNALFMNTAESDATTAVRNNPDNQAPKFKEGASTFRVVAEGTSALSGDADDDAATADDNLADNVGGPVEATDADADTPTYTLSGADAGMFRVRANGQIEVSSGANLDHETKSSLTVTLTATDSSGEANNTASITVTIYVTNVDEKPTISTTDGGVVNTRPEFTSATARRTVAENTVAGENIGGRVEATDDDSGDTLTYTLGGADAASFGIGAATGQLMTKAALDHETKDSYSVTVTATDSAGARDSIDVTITVTDVDEVVPETPLERYDANENGRIDKEELAEAVFDYNINETLEKADLADLIFSYEIG